MLLKIELNYYGKIGQIIIGNKFEILSNFIYYFINILLFILKYFIDNSNKYINKIFVMYSKYLDYTEAAVKAHHAAQVENDQKDILISHLKSDVYELRQLEGDFLKLNDLILALE